jgi:hypothetical protein
MHERRLRQIQFGGDVLHPEFIGGDIKQAHARGIARKRTIGEGIHLEDGAIHHRGEHCARGPPTLPVDYSAQVAAARRA